MSRPNATASALAPGHDSVLPSQVVPNPADALQLEAVGLHTVETYSFSGGWLPRDEYGKRPPQNIHSSPRSRRFDVSRRGDSHFVPLVGTFIEPTLLPSCARVDELVQFPGYPLNGSPQVRIINRSHALRFLPLQKISTRYWDRTRNPITRSKLAHQVAKKLEKYLNSMSVS